MKPRHISFLIAIILPLFTACDLQAPEPRQATITTTTSATGGDDLPMEQVSFARVAVEDGTQILDDLGGPCECTKTHVDGGTRSASSCDPADCADHHEPQTR